MQSSKHCNPRVFMKCPGRSAAGRSDGRQVPGNKLAATSAPGLRTKAMPPPSLGTFNVVDVKMEFRTQAPFTLYWYKLSVTCEFDTYLGTPTDKSWVIVRGRFVQGNVFGVLVC